MLNTNALLDGDLLEDQHPSKVKMLVDAGLLDEQELTDEHKRTIEQDITLEEIQILIRVGKKMVGRPSVLNKKVGCSL